MSGAEGLGQREGKRDVISRTKRLSYETNKRRRAAALKRRNEQDREAKRRQEILTKRRQNQAEATERFQRGNRHFKYTEPPPRSSTSPQPPPDLDEALRAVMGRSPSPSSSSSSVNQFAPRRHGRRSPVGRPPHRSYKKPGSPGVLVSHGHYSTTSPGSVTSSHRGQHQLMRSVSDGTAQYDRDQGWLGKFVAQDGGRKSHVGPTSGADPQLQASSVRSLHASRSLFEDQLHQQQRHLVHQQQNSLTAFNAAIQEEMQRDRKLAGLEDIDEGVVRASESCSSLDSLDEDGSSVPEQPSGVKGPQQARTKPVPPRLERPKAPTFDSGRSEALQPSNSTEEVFKLATHAGTLQIRGLGVTEKPNGGATSQPPIQQAAPPIQHAMPPQQQPQQQPGVGQDGGGFFINTRAWATPSPRDGQQQISLSMAASPSIPHPPSSVSSGGTAVVSPFPSSPSVSRPVSAVTTRPSPNSAPTPTRPNVGSVSQPPLSTNNSVSSRPPVGIAGGHHPAGASNTSAASILRSTVPAPPPPSRIPTSTPPTEAPTAYCSVKVVDRGDSDVSQKEAASANSNGTRLGSRTPSATPLATNEKGNSGNSRSSSVASRTTLLTPAGAHSFTRSPAVNSTPVVTQQNYHTGAAQKSSDAASPATVASKPPPGPTLRLTSTANPARSIQAPAKDVVTNGTLDAGMSRTATGRIVATSSLISGSSSSTGSGRKSSASTSEGPKGILKRRPSSASSATVGSIGPGVRDSLEVAKQHLDKASGQKPAKKKGIRWADMSYESDEEEEVGSFCSESAVHTGSGGAVRPGLRPQSAHVSNPAARQQARLQTAGTLRRTPFVRGRNTAMIRPMRSGGSQSSGSAPGRHSGGGDSESRKVAFVSPSEHGRPPRGLDKTPTDEEIAMLWANVRQCLDPRDGQPHPAGQPPAQTTVSQKLIDGSEIDSPYAKPRVNMMNGRVAPPHATPQQHRVNGATGTGGYARRLAMLQQQQQRRQAGRGAPAPKPSSAGPSTGHPATDPSVSESLAAFQVAEQLVGQSDITDSQIHAAMETAQQYVQVHGVGRGPGAKNPSALSVEEQRLMASLDRLNERLKANEVPVATAAEQQGGSSSRRGTQPVHIFSSQSPAHVRPAQNGTTPNGRTGDP